MRTYICIEEDEDGNDYESDRGEFANLAEAEEHFGYEGIGCGFTVMPA